MPEEPSENISGGPSGGGQDMAFEPAEPATATRAEVVVDRLGERYWRKAYGGQGGFECLVRTILSQNTSDKASQPAHDTLMARYGGDDLAESLAAADREGIIDAIRSGGLYNQKSKLIQGVAEEVLADFGSEDDFDRYVREADPSTVRDRLLEMKGVGPKTADCVLLFAGGRGGVFPVDTHVHRIARRLGVAPADADHEGVRAALEREVPAEKCGFGHTAMIQFGREFCKARKPVCLDGKDECPMADVCEKVGVDVAGQSVVDPAAADD
ncbi:endonuclease III [Haloferax mediterranei ATCC 33500]|uniref:Endonuclease III n=1 Tax=Haloferax mediterranei (strain ATCC 33500 / DSM 1411 / JCM 8866 / NBRC 14739 / NCIMB 2177 / R-4) TaxID=523841 RepID=I3R2W3_HALMT|nr:endonuclease III [Haloferax mediterranei]AFK18573.1 DNA-(apurinic or apyrimidinic site) lyase / endonuclease III [Haloferax mediterranei ATCC 33500]AHZ22051.1 endonuclease III [Haloferax mediterranei ATCC 33500]EMA02151.1 DNA-(apurinic or apyrimidinic site) lyase / endonuclease III [Haloferax mediterranei ATCC 33500]MDX5988662.1 endonuclease III [Haloferax mediterranei ATCC 33500]QCQ75074.1 endonuclease III [Haloferax mediterranei ATCC 33500]